MQVYGDYVICEDSKQRKQRIYNMLLNNTLNKMLQIFDYQNLPETIPKQYLENYLLQNGIVVISECDGYLFAYNGSFSGELNEYYIPTNVIVNNPYQRFNANLRVGVECVVGQNDYRFNGVMPLLETYTEIMTEAILSLRSQTINTRLLSVLNASDDETTKSSEILLNKILYGDTSVIKSEQFNPFGDSKGAVMMSIPNTNYILQNIELYQYAKSTLLNEIGINANWNNKRAQLNDTEVEMNNDNLIPYVENMLDCRKMMCDNVNALYGTNISVHYNPLWQSNIDDITDDINNGGDDNEQDKN